MTCTVRVSAGKAPWWGRGGRGLLKIRGLMEAPHFGNLSPTCGFYS
jgi:hypothetical protein